MAKTGQQSSNEQARVRSRINAISAARTAVERFSTLRGSQAQQVADRAVDAAGPHIRAEQFIQLAGITARRATVFGAAALVVAVADLVVYGNVAARGSRTARTAVAVLALAHTGMVVYSRATQSRVRAAARVQLAAQRRAS